MIVGIYKMHINLFLVMPKVVSFIVGTGEQEFDLVLLLGNTCLMILQNFLEFFSLLVSKAS